MLMYPKYLVICLFLLSLVFMDPFPLCGQTDTEGNVREMITSCDTWGKALHVIRASGWATSYPFYHTSTPWQGFSMYVTHQLLCPLER